MTKQVDQVEEGVDMDQALLDPDRLLVVLIALKI